MTRWLLAVCIAGATANFVARRLPSAVIANDATSFEPELTLALPREASRRVYCPGCAKLLATPLARQCFGCGLDWHHGEPRLMAAALASSASFPLAAGVVSRRSWLRQFSRLMIATLAAQIASLALVVLLFQEPAAFLLAMLVGVPTYMWLDKRLGSFSSANRLGHRAGKLLTLCSGILVITLPDRFLPVAIAVLVCAAAVGYIASRRFDAAPAIPVRMMVLVAAALAACHFLEIGAAVIGCFLATLSLVEFGGLMLALDAWEKRTRARAV